MNCLDGMHNLPDDSVDLVIADPPYVIETSGGGLYNQPDKHYVKELNDMKDGFDERVLDEICRVLKRINAYFFCSQKQILPLCRYFVDDRKCNWNLLSWHKSNPVPACGNKYLTDTEFVLFFREHGVPVYGTFDTKRTYWVTPLNQKDKRLYGHPTVKPQFIVDMLIQNSSQTGDIVLDPFLGSGTVAASAAQNKRHYLGYEINATYFDIVAEDTLDEKVMRALTAKDATQRGLLNALKTYIKEDLPA